MKKIFLCLIALTSLNALTGCAGSPAWCSLKHGSIDEMTDREYNYYMARCAGGIVIKNDTKISN